MVGYIVVEPDMHVERVPEHLLAWDDIAWPAHENTLKTKKPAEPVQYMNVNAFYHRYRLDATEAEVFVWTQRDANALPNHVTDEIRARAENDGAQP